MQCDYSEDLEGNVSGTPECMNAIDGQRFGWNLVIFFC